MMTYICIYPEWINYHTLITLINFLRSQSQINHLHPTFMGIKQSLDMKTTHNRCPMTTELCTASKEIQGIHVIIIGITISTQTYIQTDNRLQSYHILVQYTPHILYFYPVVCSLKLWLYSFCFQAAKVGPVHWRAEKKAYKDVHALPKSHELWMLSLGQTNRHFPAVDLMRCRGSALWNSAVQSELGQCVLLICYCVLPRHK